MLGRGTQRSQDPSQGNSDRYEKSYIRSIHNYLYLETAININELFILKYYISGRNADSYLHAICHNCVASYSDSFYAPAVERIAM